jgi:hypothetical protein
VVLRGSMTARYVLTSVCVHTGTMALTASLRQRLLGKERIRLVDKDGEVYEGWWTGKRAWCGRSAPTTLSSVFLYLGCLWTFFRPRRQAWHDLTANTFGGAPRARGLKGRPKGLEVGDLGGDLGKTGPHRVPPLWGDDGRALEGLAALTRRET